MSKKKGIFSTLFGKKESSCCNMEIVEEPEEKCCQGGCVDSDNKQDSKSSENK